MKILLCLVAIWISITDALTPNLYISKEDQIRFNKLFQKSFEQSDLELQFYSAKGLIALDEKILKSESACNFIKNSLNDVSIKVIYRLSLIYSKLKKDGFSCQINLDNCVKKANDVIDKENSLSLIYFATAALSNFDQIIPVDKVKVALDKALKSDETHIGYGYTMLTASFLSGDLKKYTDLIEDAIAQADEIDNKYLQFEAGIETTVVVVVGAYKLAEKANITLSINDDKIVKLANYFLKWKNTILVKEAAIALIAIRTIANQKFNIPVSVSLSSTTAISSQNPETLIHISNLMDEELAGVTVVIENVQNLQTNLVVISKKSIEKSKTNPTLYDLNLYSERVEKGFYLISVSVIGPENALPLIGNSKAELLVKVTTKISLNNIEVGISDKEQGTILKLLKVEPPNKVSLDVDHHQKLMARFIVTDTISKQSMIVHQAFVRLTNLKTQQEVIHVAEMDGTSVYKFDLDLGAKGKIFNNLSGKYQMDLIIGDVLVDNSISITIAEVKLKFSEEGAIEYEGISSTYAKKPEIKHTFRVPEKRPPAVVSNLFTCLVLVPFSILMICWARIGINFSNFQFSIWTLGFHIGLAAIFGLYYCYFVNLNMFVTLRYLALIGLPTFFCGNKMLGALASKRK